MEEKNLLRICEGILFTQNAPISIEKLAEAARETDLEKVRAVLDTLQETYQFRGVQLVVVGGEYQFRTAPDLAPYLTITRDVKKRLSRAALETLAIIAYHQPVTRADIEEIRGVTISKGTLDILLENGWIQPKGRKEVPGRPLAWGTTASFMGDFGLESLDALPGLEDLKSAGLLDLQDDKLFLSELSANDDEPQEGDERKDDQNDEELAPQLQLNG